MRSLAQCTRCEGPKRIEGLLSDGDLCDDDDSVGVWVSAYAACVVFSSGNDGRSISGSLAKKIALRDQRLCVIDVVLTLLR